MDIEKIPDIQDMSAEFSIKASNGGVEIIIDGDEIPLLTAIVTALQDNEVRRLLQDAFQIADEPTTPTRSVEEKEYLS